jgi:pimeloyl-ACP methyl ester carboxylesterase
MKRQTFLTWSTVLLTLSVLLSACGPTRTPTTAIPSYQHTPCVFRIPAGAVVSCGYLSVWEDHQHSGGSVIQIYVARFQSQTAHPAPDPVVYLVGGPGGHMIGLVPYLFTKLIKPFLATRDFILFDQRGTGYAKPALECPGITVTTGMDLEDPKLLACGERLRKEGIDLASYRSAESAADLNDLRKALGYTRWNLVGESYGTRLALTAMRDVPQGIRSVILDATVQPIGSQPEDNDVRTERALATLFDGCATDRACNRAYPDLRARFEQAVERLNASPVTLVYDVYGEQQAVMLTGNKLIRFVLDALYDSSLIPELPRAIDAVRDGSDYSFWGEVMRFDYVIDHTLSVGDNFSVACGDGTLPHDFCEQWSGQGAAAIESQPVRSDIPVLVLAGEYDPATPPYYGQATASTLSHSFFFTFPGLGHTVIGTHACPTSMALAFLDHPTVAPDAGCIAKMSEAIFVVTPR